MTKYELTMLAIAVNKLLDLNEIDTVKKMFDTVLKDADSAAAETESKEKS